jgi:hypothetical protein
MWLNELPLLIRDFSKFHSYPHNNIQETGIYSFEIRSSTYVHTSYCIQKLIKIIKAFFSYIFVRIIAKFPST